MTDHEPGGWIVDTNVVSRPVGGPHTAASPVARWLRLHAASIRLSVITVAEARRGLILAQRKIDRLGDPRARSRDQRVLDQKWDWYRQLRDRFGDRLLPIDAAVAECWADISVRFPSVRDGDKALLATALVHDLGVATRNLRDFKAMGIPLVDPFDPATWRDDESEVDRDLP